jgi:serine/threonine-protein kinase
VTSIGRYEIEAEIGRGAMGVVYLAHDPRLGRRIAIKTYHVPEGLSAEQRAEFRQRFVREAQAAARLSHHPGIVTIYDADEDEQLGQPFITMEFVPGRSLDELLRTDGPMACERACALAAQAARALQAAHREGIVHRDVKPANLLVQDEDGAMKIADFGIARLSSSDLTRSGETLGSPAYMSPEQIRGGPLDGRSDLFSLAVILYELLCGDRPFAGDDPSALVYSIVHRSPPPITERVNGLPEWIERFFRQALAKAPEDRFQDGESFALDLEQRGTDTVALPAMTVSEPGPVRIGTGEIAPDPHALDQGGLDVSLDPFPPQDEPVLSRGGRLGRCSAARATPT